MNTSFANDSKTRMRKKIKPSRPKKIFFLKQVKKWETFIQGFQICLIWTSEYCCWG